MGRRARGAPASTSCCAATSTSRAPIATSTRSLRKPMIGQIAAERALIDALFAHGLVDVGRLVDPDNDRLFTWWAPWRNMRQRNIGWRLDYVAAQRTRSSTTTRALRGVPRRRHERSRAGHRPPARPADATVRAMTRTLVLRDARRVQLQTGREQKTSRRRHRRPRSPTPPSPPSRPTPRSRRSSRPPRIARPSIRRAGTYFNDARYDDFKNCFADERRQRHPRARSGRSRATRSRTTSSSSAPRSPTSPASRTSCSSAARR